jgi:Ca2+-transporting ATPase
VTEVYVVDETILVDSAPDSAVPLMENHFHSIRKLLEVGSICNNASETRNANGVYIGQSTDVALLNALSSFGLEDMRQVIQRTIIRSMS